MSNDPYNYSASFGYSNNANCLACSKQGWCNVHPRPELLIHPPKEDCVYFNVSDLPKMPDKNADLKLKELTLSQMKETLEEKLKRIEQLKAIIMGCEQKIQALTSQMAISAGTQIKYLLHQKMMEVDRLKPFKEELAIISLEVEKYYEAYKALNNCTNLHKLRNMLYGTSKMEETTDGKESKLEKVVDKVQSGVNAAAVAVKKAANKAAKRERRRQRRKAVIFWIMAVFLMIYVITGCTTWYCVKEGLMPKQVVDTVNRVGGSILSYLN